MRIQIDIDLKTVQILDSGNLFEIVKLLKVMLGDDYDKYTLRVNTQTVYYPWVNPIYISYPAIPVQPYHPTWTTTTAGNTGTSVYNLELQVVN